MNTRQLCLVLFWVCATAIAATAQSLTVPTDAVAGEAVSIATTGTGSATLYVYGPGAAIKRKIELGQPIQLAGEEVKYSGRYTVIVNGNHNEFAVLYINPAKLENLAFLARPSRVPTSRPGVINGSAYLFDKYNNLVLAPYPVKFDLSVEGAPAITRAQNAKLGVAWVRLDSGKKAGATQFIASYSGDGSAKRVVQQTASDPCNIKMRAQPAKNGNILAETEPIRDCSGNPVPDGTIVTFTSSDNSGRSTVDARIKRGIAQAELPPSRNATLSVASGVVLGNEIHWGGQ